MVQVYNSKAVGAGEVELGARVRWPVSNCHITNLRLGQSTTSAAVCCRRVYVHVYYNENKHK